MTWGDSWHHNHHAFAWSARHGLEWWQLDPTWWLIRALERAGVATRVQQPSAAQKAKLAL